jgi:hypothetical protein
MYDVTDSGVFKTVESWSVVVPLYDNDGQKFDKATIESILQEILLNYPGFSLSNIIGYWKGEERTYTDRNYQVLIDTVPDNSQDSSKFFALLKQELQERLQQEKIYITKQESKQEFLSFDEFFMEVGIEARSNDLKKEASQVAKQLVGKLDFVLERLGYETTVLRRNHEQKKIIWERKLCGIKLRSELDDDIPSEIDIFAADQLNELGAALARAEAFAIIGSYEATSYILEKRGYRNLVEANDLSKEQIETQYLSQIAEPLSVKRFIEEFTMSVFTNWLILRDEGFLPKEITLSVGSDGSLQHGANEAGGILLHCPATIPEDVVQKEIIRCLAAAIHLYEDNKIDPIAVLQAKAKNNYVLKRAFVRHTLKRNRAA